MNMCIYIYIYMYIYIYIYMNPYLCACAYVRNVLVYVHSLTRCMHMPVVYLQMHTNTTIIYIHCRPHAVCTIFVLVLTYLTPPTPLRKIPGPGCVVRRPSWWVVAFWAILTVYGRGARTHANICTCGCTQGVLTYINVHIGYTD